MLCTRSMKETSSSDMEMNCTKEEEPTEQISPSNYASNRFCMNWVYGERNCSECRNTRVTEKLTTKDEHKTAGYCIDQDIDKVIPSWMK
mmetsp:Transcript_23264/g.71573  ORF Transcript_23264/g.71573 Transcript_23264/m.71573 type:complete len:89 (+) Transcript_23264:2046-2312(+)